MSSHKDREHKIERVDGPRAPQAHPRVDAPREGVAGAAASPPPGAARSGDAASRATTGNATTGAPASGGAGRTNEAGRVTGAPPSGEVRGPAGTDPRNQAPGRADSPRRDVWGSDGFSKSIDLREDEKGSRKTNTFLSRLLGRPVGEERARPQDGAAVAPPPTSDYRSWEQAPTRPDASRPVEATAPPGQNRGPQSHDPSSRVARDRMDPSSQVPSTASRDRSGQAPASSTSSRQRLEQEPQAPSVLSRDRSGQAPTSSTSSRQRLEQEPQAPSILSRDRSGQAPTSSTSSRQRLEQEPQAPSILSRDRSGQAPHPSPSSQARADQAPQGPSILSRNRADQAPQGPSILSRNRADQAPQGPSTLSRNRADQAPQAPSAPARDRAGQAPQAPSVLARDRAGQASSPPSLLSRDWTPQAQKASPADPGDRGRHDAGPTQDPRQVDERANRLTEVIANVRTGSKASPTARTPGQVTNATSATSAHRAANAEGHPSAKTPPGIARTGDLPEAEARKVNDWYSKQSPHDQSFYRNYLNGVNPSDKEAREKALTLFTRIDDKNVSDPKEKDALRRLALDQGIKTLDPEQARYVNKIVLTDEAHKDAAIKANQFGKGDGQTVKEIQGEVAAYNPQNRRLLFDTSLLDRNSTQRSDIAGHEYSHPVQGYEMTAQGKPNRSTDMAYRVDLYKSWHNSTDTRAERQKTRTAMTDMYTHMGYGKKEAAEKAQYALQSPQEYDASYRGLWQSQPKERARLEKLDPRMADLMHREQSGRIRTDEQFMKTTDLNKLAKELHLNPRQLERFRGMDKDPARQQEFRQFLDQRLGYNQGTLGSGTYEEPSSGGKDPSGVTRVSTVSHLGGDGNRTNVSNLSGGGDPGTGGSTSAGGSTTTGGSATTGGSTTPSTATGAGSSTGVSTPSTMNPATSYPQASSGGGYQAPTYTSYGSTTASTDPFGGSAFGSSLTSSSPFGFPAAWGGDSMALQSFFQGAGFASFAPGDMAWLQADLSRLSAQGLLGSGDVALAQQFLQSGQLPQGDGSRQSLQQLLTTVMNHHREDAAAPNSGAFVDVGGGRTVAYRIPTANDPGQVPGAPKGPAAHPPMSLAEQKQIRGEVHELVKKVATKPMETKDFRHLATATDTSAGARGLADSLEWSFAQRGGDRHVVGLFDQAAATPETARLMTHSLAQMAAADPVRATGILLLATDTPGGTHHLNRMLDVASQTPQGSMAFASFLEKATRNPDAARGVGELLDTLTESSLTGDRTASKRMAAILRQSSNWVSGSRDVSSALVNTLDAEGGSRSVARLFHRMSGTNQGVRDTGQMLQNMTFESAGSANVSKVFARITESRDGSRLLLETLNRVADSRAGLPAVNDVFARILEAPSGSRFLANAAGDSANAQALAQLLDKMGTRTSGNRRLSNALERITASSGPDTSLFRNRAAESKELSGSLERFAVKAGPAAPSTVETLPLTTHGQQAMNYFRPPVAADAAQAAPTSPAGVAAASTAVTSAPGRATGAPPTAPTDALGGAEAVEQTSTAPALNRVLASKSSERPPPPPKESTRRSVDKTAEPRLQRVQAVHEEKPGEVRPSTDRALPTGVPLGPGREMDTRPPLAFRPGDVYSEDTLRSARICPDCGFRLNHGGACARCNEYSRREAMAQLQQA